MQLRRLANATRMHGTASLQWEKSIIISKLKEESKFVQSGPWWRKIYDISWRTTTATFLKFNPATLHACHRRRYIDVGEVIQHWMFKSTVYTSSLQNCLNRRKAFLYVFFVLLFTIYLIISIWNDARENIGVRRNIERPQWPIIQPLHAGILYCGIRDGQIVKVHQKVTLHYNSRLLRQNRDYITDFEYTNTQAYSPLLKSSGPCIVYTYLHFFPQSMTDSNFCGLSCWLQSKLSSWRGVGQVIVPSKCDVYHFYLDLL